MSKIPSILRQEARRTTLTRFRLSRYAKWPNWTNAVTDTTEQDDSDEEPTTKRQVHDMTLKQYFHGPLADIDGAIKVRLARTVDDVENAVFIILWESADHLKAFQESPALTEPFLRGLGILPEDDRPTTSHFTTLQYDWGFPIGERNDDPDGMDGRITLVTMDIPYLKSQGQDREGWRKILNQGPGSLTSMKEYKEPWGDFQFPRYYTASTAYTFRVDGADEVKTDPTVPAGATAHRATEEEKEMETAVCCLFHRWNLRSQMREKEEFWFREPGGEGRVAEAISKARPLVRSWKIERWDVETALCCWELCRSLEEEEGPLPPKRYEEEEVTRTCRLR